MPFSQTTNKHTQEYWNGHYAFLKPIIEKNPNIKAHRSEPLRGDILKQFINDLVVSSIVVADLTDKNANVFWELGVRQSFKHGTITIAEYGTKLPFDIYGKGTLFYYPKGHINNKDFTTQLEAAIIDCLSHPERPDSHVLESISGRGTMFEIFRRDEATRRLGAVLIECDMNLRVMNTIIEACTKNKNKSWLDKFKLTDKIYYNIPPLSTIAIELLVTHRYLDENKDFYELAETYLLMLTAINRQNDNFTYRDSAEEFILKNRYICLLTITDFRRVAKTALDKLNKLV
jgi:hypothetical protein